MKFKKMSIAALAVLFLSGTVFAVNPNLSIDYVRMLARYATVNSADAAIFNPAGIPKLEDGLYVDITNQFVYKKYSADIAAIPPLFPGTSLVNSTGTRFSPLFPSAIVAFKQNNWGVFATFTVPDGGGSLEYDFIGSNVKASSQWFDVTLGGSYAINDYIALSLGARMLLPKQTSDMGKEEVFTGTGFSGQFGVNVTPIEKLNIGILYKSQAFWAKVDKTPADDPRFYAPNVIQVGIGYDVLDNLNVQFGYKINLETLHPTKLLDGEKYKNSMDFTLGAEYQINSFIKPSLGLGYQMARGTKETNDELNGMMNPDLNAFVVGAGVVVTPVKNLNITLGYMCPVFMKQTVPANLTSLGLPIKPDVTLKKTVHVFGIGVSYKFF